MSKTTEDVKNELTGLQYSIDQILLSKINIDLIYISNTSFKKEILDNSEVNFDSRKEIQEEWERKVTEAAGLEYDKSKPFDREKVYSILGDQMEEMVVFDKEEAAELSGKAEIDTFLQNVEVVLEMDKRLDQQLDNYLDLFDPNQQSDFHLMLDALQNMVEWSENYSQKIKTMKPGKSSKKEIEDLITMSEFLSLCCNWLSSTVSTVLKYGFEDIEQDYI